MLKKALLKNIKDCQALVALLTDPRWPSAKPQPPRFCPHLLYLLQSVLNLSPIKMSFPISKILVDFSAPSLCDCASPLQLVCRRHWHLLELPPPLCQSMLLVGAGMGLNPICSHCHWHTSRLILSLWRFVFCFQMWYGGFHPSLIGLLAWLFRLGT